MSAKVILVDAEDNETGTCEKIEVHRKGYLHRAFSIFIFNSKGQVLIQKRAKTKYHSAGLWSNTCCSHPAPGEATVSAAHRRLKEEMGMDCDLNEAFCLMYKIIVSDDLIEHEYNHVLFGISDGEPCPNIEEVEDWRWQNLAKLKEDTKLNPSKYSNWLVLLLNKI
jgi:isopentenyl-diphosphate delta-isomerase